MKIGLKEIAIGLGIYLVAGSVSYFVNYYLARRFPNVFSTADSRTEMRTPEFFLMLALWWVVYLMWIGCLYSYFTRNRNMNPIHFICDRIDRIVDRQQGKLNKDVVLKFKMK